MCPLSLRRGVAAGSLAAVLAACSRDTVAPSAASTSLTPQQVVAVAGQISHELDVSIGALSIGARGVGGVASLTLGATSAAGVSTAAPCPLVDNAADADRDGVPDNATLTFQLPQCRSVVAGDTTELTGTVHIVDPVLSPPPNPAAFGYQASVTNFVVRFGAADAAASFTETRNGAEALLVGPQGLEQTHGFNVVRQDRDGTAFVAQTWLGRFIPAAGSALVPGAPLPNGTYATAGHSSWQRGNDAAQFEIATAVPLAYDASCPELGPNRFRSGEVHAALAGPGHHAFIRIVFANCAAPSVTLIAQS